MLFLCALHICFDYLNISIFSPEIIYQKQQKWDCVKSKYIMVLLLFRACSRIHINYYLKIRYIYKRDLPSGHLSFSSYYSRHYNVAGIHHKMENVARFLLMECTFHECIQHSRSVYNFILFRATLHSRVGEIYCVCYGLLKV